MSDDTQPEHPSGNGNGQPKPGARPDLFNGAGLIPGNPGNSGGKKGRSGRPRKEFYAFCREVLEDPRVQSAVRKRAKAGDAAIIRILADRVIVGEEPAKKAGSDELDQFLGRLARAAAAGSAEPVAGGAERG